MSILHSSVRPSGASRRSSEVWLREALLTARRGPVVHRATIIITEEYDYYILDQSQNQDKNNAIQISHLGLFWKT